MDQPEEILKAITAHFQNYFSGTEPMVEHTNETLIENLVSDDEVRQAIQKLNSGRAVGPDGISAEGFKIISQEFSSLFGVFIQL